MTDRWKNRLARIDRAVDRVMSETVRFVPVRDADFSGVVPDPQRLSFVVDGVLVIDRGETDTGGNALRLRNTQVRTAKAELQIMKSLLPPGFKARKNDRFEAVDQGLVFKIERIDREHEGRVAFVLSIVAEDL